MTDKDAFKLATDLLAKFIESQEIPPGGTSGSAASHGEKTAQFLTAMHRTLYAYFRQAEEK
ncbi:MAG TPA: hypothetical protein VFK48_11120 [Usitatibacter sp.]|nr:hypothetical protein [Usitatibacter sp.]